MKMMNKYLIFICAFLVVSTLGTVFISLDYLKGKASFIDSTSQGVSVNGAFTYQGKLSKGGGLITDSCQMAFRLFDSEAMGDQIGEVITTSVPVTGGLFTVVLNESGQFGASAFNGEARWLEIRVKCPGDVDFTNLNRQAITSAPYSSYSLSTSSLQGYPLTTTAPSLGQSIVWNGSEWIPSSIIVNKIISGTVHDPSDPGRPDDTIVLTHPFEFDISELGNVQPEDVVVIYCGYKSKDTADQPEKPIWSNWEVFNSPSLTLKMNIWDYEFNPYDYYDAVNWQDWKLRINIVATLNQE